MAATKTTNLDMDKQALADHVDVTLLNGNFDILDRIIGFITGRSISERLSNLSESINVLCLKGSTTTFTGNSTQNVSLTGLSAAHVVVDFGLSVGSIGDPPADIEIIPGSGSYSIIVTNYYGPSFSVTPVFALPQN